MSNVLYIARFVHTIETILKKESEFRNNTLFSPSSSLLLRRGGGGLPSHDLADHLLEVGDDDEDDEAEDEDGEDVNEDAEDDPRCPDVQERIRRAKRGESAIKSFFR